MNDFTDPTANLILGMQEEALKELENETNPEPEETEEITQSPYKTFVQKIKPKYSREDQFALQQIRAASDEQVSEIFGDVLSSLDALYLQVRVPKRKRGEYEKDLEGRIVFETDEYGNPEEDWSRLTSQDIEKVLIKLSTIKFVAAKQVNDLFLEALYAKLISKDVWHEAYESVLQGTTGDREARANRVYKDEKYQAYLRYSNFSSSNVILQELNAILRLLDKLRDGRQRLGS